jgi:hypothetical protein
LTLNSQQPALEDGGASPGSAQPPNTSPNAQTSGRAGTSRTSARYFTTQPRGDPIFTLAYARLYYAEPRGGVNFNEETPPDYRDFAYLSFTIGMTFQVSDTNLETKEIRRTALRHALLSYAFGAGIIATTINLIATITGQ